MAGEPERGGCGGCQRLPEPYHGASLKPATDEAVEKIRAVTLRRFIIRRIGLVKWSSLPLETLEKIVAILPET